MAHCNQYSLSVSTDGGGYIVSVWIDFDQNGIFDPYEWNQVTTNSTLDGDTVNVDIPFGIPGGQTGMRVRSRGATNGAIDACTQFFSGETEDYIVTIDIGTGIKNVTNSSSLNVAPNPANESININFVNQIADDTQLKMYTTNGQLIFHENLNQFVGNYRKNLDVTNYPKGIYFIQMITNNNVVTKKVVIK